MRVAVSVTLLMFALLACSPAEPRRPAGAPDKRELFADPSLVPTREGERARRELALADELERLLARAEIPASVTVSLIEPASAVVVARSDELEATRTIAHAALPAIAPERITISLAEPNERAPLNEQGARGLPIVLLALGLGLASGVALERARLRYSAHSAG
ncbi:hypothetical protein ACNOYE_26085 [Nannocystaceae bacterium ST9]